MSDLRLNNKELIVKALTSEFKEIVNVVYFTADPKVVGEKLCFIKTVENKLWGSEISSLFNKFFEYKDKYYYRYLLDNDKNVEFLINRKTSNIAVLIKDGRVIDDAVWATIDFISLTIKRIQNLLYIYECVDIIRTATADIENKADYVRYLNCFERELEVADSEQYKAMAQKVVETWRYVEHSSKKENVDKKPSKILETAVEILIAQYKNETVKTPTVSSKKPKPRPNPVKQHLNTVLNNTQAMLIRQVDYYCSKYVKSASREQLNDEHYAGLESLMLVNPEFNYLYRHYLNVNLTAPVKVTLLVAVVKACQLFPTTVRDLLYAIEHHRNVLNTRNQKLDLWWRDAVDSEGYPYLLLVEKLIADINVYKTSKSDEKYPYSRAIMLHIAWWADHYRDKL